MFENFINQLIGFGRNVTHVLGDVLRRQPWLAPAAVVLVLLLW